MNEKTAKILRRFARLQWRKAQEEVARRAGRTVRPQLPGDKDVTMAHGSLGHRKLVAWFEALDHEGKGRARAWMSRTLRAANAAKARR